MHSTICEVNKPRQNCNRINILLLTTIMKFIEDISSKLFEIDIETSNTDLE